LLKIQKPESIAENKMLQEKNKEIYEGYLKSVVAKDEALLQYERARIARQDEEP